MIGRRLRHRFHASNCFYRNCTETLIQTDYVDQTIQCLQESKTYFNMLLLEHQRGYGPAITNNQFFGLSVARAIYFNLKFVFELLHSNIGTWLTSDSL